ncbi:MAG: DNA-binding response regulator [Acidobacteria bacterium]|nr:MAG: DNA-binding response regulator [Acidobacteriota bacterium]
MNSIRVCIIDDEPIACRKIQGMLKDHPEIEVLEICKNGDDASTAIQRHLPDLIFLDVQMPGIDGFAVLESLKELQKFPHVIFITAYDRYAVRAFEFHAFDYLLKPFDKKRFDDALARAKTELLQKSSESYNRDLVTLLNEMKNPVQSLDRMVINNRVVKTDEIDWIEAQGKYSLIHSGHDADLVREGLSDFEAQLDSRKFLRIHKSTIVNVDRIERLHPLFHGDCQIILRDGTVLTVSRRYRGKLNERLGKPL